MIMCQQTRIMEAKMFPKSEKMASCCKYIVYFFMIFSSFNFVLTLWYSKSVLFSSFMLNCKAGSLQCYFEPINCNKRQLKDGVYNSNIYLTPILLI